MTPACDTIFFYHRYNHWLHQISKTVLRYTFSYTLSYTLSYPAYYPLFFYHRYNHWLHQISKTVLRAFVHKFDDDGFQRGDYPPHSQHIIYTLS